MQGDEDEDDLNTDTVPLPQFISGAAHHRGQGSFVGERMGQLKVPLQRASPCSLTRNVSANVRPRTFCRLAPFMRPIAKDPGKADGCDIVRAGLFLTMGWRAWHGRAASWHTAVPKRHRCSGFTWHNFRKLDPGLIPTLPLQTSVVLLLRLEAGQHTSAI